VVRGHDELRATADRLVQRLPRALDPRRIEAVERLVEQQESSRPHQRSREQRETELAVGDLPRPS
jgi:hypothetical protein